MCLKRRTVFYCIYLSAVLTFVGCEQQILNNKLGTHKSEPVSNEESYQLPGFHKKANGLTSGPIVLVDKKTLYISNLKFDDSIPDSYFWVGNDTKSIKDGIIIPDEKSSLQNLLTYNGQNIYLTLPTGMEINQIKYFGVWSKKHNLNVDYVTIPKDVALPESSRFTNLTDDGRKILRVPKCCDKDKVLDHSSGCIKWKPFETFNVTVYENNITHINDVPLNESNIKFEPYTSNVKCDNFRYPLIPSIDNVILLSNESMLNIDTKTVLFQGEYCLEFIEDDNVWTTAMLVCGDSQTDNAPKEMYIVYSVGVIASAIFLILTAIYYYKVSMDIRGKCIIGYSLSMGVTFITLAVAQLSNVGETACNLIGFIFQFFLILSFTWLTMITIETYRKVKHCNAVNVNEHKVFYKYLVSAFFVPLIVVVVSVASDKIPDVPYSFFKPKFGYNDCWFIGEKQKLRFFYIPVIIAIVINIVIVVITKSKIMHYEKLLMSEEVPSNNTMWNWNYERRKLKQMFRACYLVLAIMIVCWVAEVVTYSLRSEHSIIYAIDVIESLQGLFVFFVFVYYNPLKKIKLGNFKIQCFDKV